MSCYVRSVDGSHTVGFTLGAMCGAEEVHAVELSVTVSGDAKAMFMQTGDEQEAGISPVLYYRCAQ
jgi:hypothetical protein